MLVVRGRPRPTGPVLLAVDGSPSAADAVGFAFAEASLRGAELEAVHVWNLWSEPVDEATEPPLNLVSSTERLHEDAERLLAESLAGRQEAYPDVVVRRRLVRGRVRPVLLAAARDAALVVVGARGRGGAGGLLLGSVSQAVLHHADAPVAVVRGAG